MNEKRQQSKHPILSGVVKMLLTYIGTYGLGYVCMIVGLLILRVTGALGDGDVDLTAFAEQISNVLYLIIPVFAVIAMLIFCRRNRKNGYLGAVKNRGRNCKDVWICIGIFVIAFIARFFHGPLTIPGGFGMIHLGLAFLPLHICAGIAEEIVHRGIPMAVMMRGEPDSKRIRRALIVTSVMFSLIHLTNGFSTENTVVQLIATFIMGLFWGAIYLRTGSILITVVFHFLYDVFTEMLVLPDPIQASNLIFMFVVQLLPLIFTFVLMRRSKTEDIKATWANIWSE